MPEACRPAERLVAQAARVRAVVAVLVLMRLQYETGLEGFAAFLTHVRARFAVLRVPVGSERIGSVGAVVALITGVRLRSCNTKIAEAFLTLSFLLFKCVLLVILSRNVKIK